MDAIVADIVQSDVLARAAQLVPCLMADECVAHSSVMDVARDLRERGLIAAAGPTSPHRLKTPDGRGVLAWGDRPKSLFDGIPLRESPGRPWKDRLVANTVAVQFMVHDRLVLLTGDTGLDRGGLRMILSRELAPALAKHDASRRLGLLVFIMKGQDVPRFAGAVRALFPLADVAPGVTERFV
jgi:hypothetical protein